MKKLKSVSKLVADVPATENRMLIPVEAAHHNEMMSPTVTE